MNLDEGLKELLKSIAISSVPITEKLIEKYKSSDNMLGHAKFDKDYTGKMLLIGNKLVGYVIVDKKRKYITALEVSPKFRRKGYGKRLLNIAKLLGADKLSVNKKNFKAINLYKKNGWIVDKEDDTMLYMRKK